MRKLLLLVALGCACQRTIAQTDGVPFFSADSLKNIRDLDGSWRYFLGDDLARAAPSYNDSGWSEGSSRIALFNGAGHPKFQGAAWFRLRFAIDSSLVNVPLGLAIQHYGASEIYLDGKLLTTYGRVAPRDSVRYYTPQSLPFIFTLGTPGEHILAVRYAQWPGGRWTTEHNFSAGFDAELSLVNKSLRGTTMDVAVGSAALIFLFTIFFTLAIVHLLLFLYQRAGRANLLFSLFGFSIALFIIGGYVQVTFRNAKIALFVANAEPFLGLVACIALSGFINALFGRSKWRSRAVTGLALIAAVWMVFEPLEVPEFMALLFVVLVSLEAVVLTLIATIRRTPGARIIMAGFGFVSLVILVATILLFARGGGGRFSTMNSTVVTAIVILLALSIVAIPLSMSAYLAWNFANVNRRLQAELVQVETLSKKNRQQEEDRQQMLENRQQELEREVALRTEQLRGEKQKSDTLLLNILPEEVAEELKEKGFAQARLHNDVTVLFTDFVEFTRYSEMLAPAEIVAELDGCFKAFDEIVTRHGLEKIKTIGDAFMAVAGLPLPHTNGAAATVRAALDIREYIRQRRLQRPDSFDIRIGVHSGPVVAGIIGVKKFAYDVWGDTVNTASRMEQSSEPGRINISAATQALIGGDFACVYRGEVAAKGKGVMGMYFVESAHNAAIAVAQ